jgi:hypothetical protein
MQHYGKRLMAVVLLSGVAVSGCAKSSEFNSEEAENEGVAKVEQVKGVDHVILTPKAAQRLGIETAPVTRSAQRTTVPYSAVLYDEDGEAFTFTSPGRLTYVETRITVDHVAGGRAILKRGPKAGTPVVTVGSAELLGTAHGVEEE